MILSINFQLMSMFRTARFNLTYHILKRFVLECVYEHMEDAEACALYVNLTTLYFSVISFGDEHTIYTLNRTIPGNEYQLNLNIHVFV